MRSHRQRCCTSVVAIRRPSASVVGVIRSSNRYLVQVESEIACRVTREESKPKKMFPCDLQKVYVFQGACFVDAIWYGAVKEVLGEEEESKGEEEGSEEEAAGHGGVVRWVEGV